MKNTFKILTSFIWRLAGFGVIFLTAFILIGVAVLGCKSPTLSQKTEINAATNAFQTLLDSSVNANMPGILVHVECPQQKISWTGSAGVSDLNTQSKLRSDQTFRIASVTKTFVACSILRLYEGGVGYGRNHHSKAAQPLRAQWHRQGQYRQMALAYGHADHQLGFPQPHGL